jgi:hypothetical protein
MKSKRPSFKMKSQSLIMNTAPEEEYTPKISGKTWIQETESSSFHSSSTLTLTNTLKKRPNKYSSFNNKWKGAKRKSNNK